MKIRDKQNQLLLITSPGEVLLEDQQTFINIPSVKKLPFIGSKLCQLLLWDPQKSQHILLLLHINELKIFPVTLRFDTTKIITKNFGDTKQVID